MKKIIYLLVFLLSNGIYAQEPITSIPFELYGDHIIIKVNVDKSRDLDFIFDTGSGLTVIDDDIAPELKLPISDAHIKGTVEEWKLIKHNTMDIDGFPMETNIKIYSTNLNHLEMSIGKDIDGITGYDLLKHHSIYVDYDQQVMKIYELGKAPQIGYGIPFGLHIAVPIIEGTVVLNNKEEFTGNFFVMSGAGTTLDFNTPFAYTNNVLDKTGKHYTYLVKGLPESELKHHEGHILSLKFGNQKINDLPIGISTSKSGVQNDQQTIGIIGSEILRLYNFSLDYKTKMFYIKKDKKYKPNFIANCSGIDLQLDKEMENVLVHQVIENSPASEAGVMVNDVLTQINEKSIEGADLPDIEKMLKLEGEKISLVVLRNGEEKSFTMKLKSLIK